MGGGQAANTQEQTTQQTTATTNNTTTSTNITSNSNNPNTSSTYAVLDSNNTGLTGGDLATVTQQFTDNIDNILNTVQNVSNNQATVEQSFLGAAQASQQASTGTGGLLPATGSSNAVKLALILAAGGLVFYLTQKK